MKYIVSICQRGGDLVYYRGVVQSQEVSFTRVIGLKEVTMKRAGDYIDVIFLDADNEFAIDKLGKGHFSFDEAVANNTDEDAEVIRETA
jgi:hypothetical protein